MKASVLAAVTDLLFLARIQRAAEQLGLAVIPVRNVADVLAAARSERPAVIIFDLMDRRIDAEAALGALKTDDRLKGIPTIGFFAHVHTEVKERAQRAGCDRVLPRSAFIVQLAHLLTEILTSAENVRRA